MAVGAFLRLGLAASMLLASPGAGYFFGAYVPEQDSALILENTVAYAHNSVAQQQSALAERQMEIRRGVQRAAAGERYQSCLSKASAGHDTSWATECKRIADRLTEARADCLSKSKLPQGYCDAAYRVRDASPNCVLPVAIATDIDFSLSRARKRCQQEREAALQ